MSNEKKFYITTPIFYPNAKPHMGHAYTVVLSDCLARYHRLVGDSTYLLSGLDENTQKMVNSARAVGKEPLEFLDGIASIFKNLYTELDISNDQFIRTTDRKAHWPGAQALWQKLVDSGDIYKKSYEGLYCVGHEAFVTEKDLVDGKCPDHATAPEFVKEENYFFRLSRYAQQLREKIASDELHIFPQSRKNEILSFIDKEGLDDVSFSRPRKADWPKGLGIPVPGDDSQVMYVWCDALSNYITALGYGRNDELFKTFWPADVHVIGKDILRFHAAIWPGMLMSAGLPLPKSLMVHGLILSGGKKMSKTLGNVIDSQDLLTEYGAEAVRYYLARHVTPFEDGDVTPESFKEVYNANLANGLGNLAARVMKLAETHLEKVDVPELVELPPEYVEAFEKFEINRAFDIIFSRVQALDQMITQTEPFKLVKTDLEAGKKLIADMAKELYRIGHFLTPFLPKTAEKIKEAVRTNKKPETLFPRK